MKKALITGVNGFVGRYLAEYLLTQDVEVIGTYRNQIHDEDKVEKTEYYKLDVLNQEELGEIIVKTEPDYIFNLAAQSSAAISWKNPQKTMEVNINGTINLLQSIRGIGLSPRILLVGSSEEYGFIKPEDIPVNEQQDIKPGNPYAVSKIAQTLIGEVYSRAYNMEIIMVRAFNHIGPRQSATFVASDFAKRIAQMEKGILEPVLLVGNLEAKRDFTDVRDIVRAYYMLMSQGEKGEIYNIGSGNQYEIQYILDSLLELTNIDIEIKRDPNRMRPSDVTIVQCDNTKLKRITSWKPEYTIKETLLDIINYWRKTV